MKNREEIEHMVKYVIDTNDEEEIRQFADALEQLSAHFKKGESPINANNGEKITTITLGSKTYYGKVLVIRKGKVYLDGKRLFDSEVEEMIARANEENSLIVEGNLSLNEVDYNLEVIGNVTANELTVGSQLTVDKVEVDGDLVVRGRIDAEKLTVNGNVIVTADSVSVGKLAVKGDVILNGNCEIENSHVTESMEICGDVQIENNTVEGDLTITQSAKKHDSKRFRDFDAKGAFEEPEQE